MSAKTSDLKRVDRVALILANSNGVDFEFADPRTKAELRRLASEICSDLAAYDREQHAMKVRRGQRAAQEAGTWQPGRNALDAQTEAAVRRMLQQRLPSRVIREELGVGNSVISRLKLEISHEQHTADVQTAA